MMSLPVGVSSFNLLYGKTYDFEGNSLRTDITVFPSHEIVWAATGERLTTMRVTSAAGTGEFDSVELPHTDQAGFVDTKGNAITNWWYTVQSVDYDGQEAAAPSKTRKIQAPVGIDTVDLDLVPTGGTVGPVGSVPLPAVLSVNGQTGAVEFDAEFLDAVPLTAVAAADGVASLDATSKVPVAQIPVQAIADDPILTGAIGAVVAATPVAFADRGEQFMTNLRYGADDMNVGIAGDSTGNAATEWGDLLMADLGADYPSVRVLIKHWNTGSESYDAAVEVQAGTPGTVGTVFSDTFTRTAADLFATDPDLGSAWGRDGTNAAGDWSVDGSKAVRSADATTGNLLADVMQTGAQRVSIVGVLSTTSGAATRQARLLSNYVGPTDHCYAQVSISTSGVSTYSLIVRTAAGGVRTIATATATGLTTNTASQTITWEIELVGLTISATLNGQTLSGAITTDEQTVLTAGTKAGFNSSGWTAGNSITSFDVEITAGSPARELVLWNASAPGQKLDYQESRVAAMFPVPLDALFVSSVHNYGTDLAPVYWPKLDSFVTAFRVLQPTAGVVVSSQNPRKPPALSSQHAARNVSLPSYCARRGFGYLPVFEAFSDELDGGWSLIKSDGVHPTEGASGTGSALWSGVAKSYLDAL